MPRRASLRWVQDLTRLVAVLGHQPLWEVVPGVSARSGLGSPGPTVVGQTGELPWFAIESEFPERDAGRLAQRICRNGRTGLVLALDPDRRWLVVAVGFERCPRLGIDLDHPSAEAVAPWLASPPRRVAERWPLLPGRQTPWRPRR